MDEEKKKEEARVEYKLRKTDNNEHKKNEKKI